MQAVLLKELQVVNGTLDVGWPAPTVAILTAAADLVAHYSCTAMPAVIAVSEHTWLCHTACSLKNNLSLNLTLTKQIVKLVLHRLVQCITLWQD